MNSYFLSLETIVRDAANAVCRRTAATSEEDKANDECFDDLIVVMYNLPSEENQ